MIMPFGGILKYQDLRKGSYQNPNRKCADIIITRLLRNKQIKNSKQFLRRIHDQRKYKKQSMLTILKRREIQLSSLFEQLIQAQDREQANCLGRQHRRNF